MTNTQLYFAMGVPTFAVFVSILIALYQNTHSLKQIDARFTSLESNMNARFTSIDGRFTSIDGRFSSIDARIASVEQDLRYLVKSTNEFDVRLARLEERTAR